jgi:hypothetical protein
VRILNFMGHTIPVFTFLVDPGGIPSHLLSWQDATDMISARYNQRVQEENLEGYVESASRNWWHQHLLFLICRAYDLKGLEFVTQEVACLQKEALFAGRAGLDRLFSIIESGSLLEKIEAFELYSDILDQEYLNAFHQAEIAAAIEPFDGGFQAAVSFFAFLKSLKTVIAEAYHTEQGLLYVMPSFNDLGGVFDDH